MTSGGHDSPGSESAGTPESGNGVPVADPAPVLLSGSTPVDKAQLAVDREFDIIEERVRLGSHAEHFRVVITHRTELEEFVQRLHQESPSIVHFTGHGSERAELFFENDAGLSYVVTTEQLDSLFAEFRGVVRCVVLNACYSAAQAEVIAKHADAVVGMSDKVTDAASHSFSDAFYEALASGRDVATAFDLAVVNIDLAGIDEAKTPALFGRERAAMLVYDGTIVEDAEVTTTVDESIVPIVREVYESGYLGLVRLASTLIDSVSVCEGIVQEAFVRALTNRDELGGTDPRQVLATLRRWVFEIAEQRQAEGQRLAPGTSPPAPSGAATPDGEVALTEVLRMVQQLPAAERMALVMSTMSGIDEHEVAQAVRTSVDEVAATAHAAVGKVEGSLMAQIGGAAR